MSDHSAIEWTDATWPAVTGCDFASPGCANCYALRDGIRLAGNPNAKVRAAYQGLVVKVAGRLRWTGVVRPLPERLDWPLKWRKPRRVFVCNQSDLFHEAVSDEFIDRVFAVMALCPQHTFQVLTKRPERMRAYLGDDDVTARIAEAAYEPWALHLAPQETPFIERWPLDGENHELKVWPLPNVWLGVSVENQHWADERIPLLLQTPAAERFISAEPLLGPVDLSRWLRAQGGGAGHCFTIDNEWWHEPGTCTGPICLGQCCGRGLDWVIVGGESGPGARPFDVAWARSIVAQCKAAGVACFVKQLGARAYGPDVHSVLLRNRKGGDMSEWPEDLRVRQFPDPPAARGEGRADA